MTPDQFKARWQNNKLSERAGAQAHFDDLCDLLGVEKPRDPANYCFERGAKKSDGSDGWADVWKRDHFGWENKRPGRDLKAALKQLTDYSLELENPPLLVVCDRERIEIHTAFTGYPDEPRTIVMADIGLPESLQTLRWVFTDPEKLRPVKSLAAITEEAAGTFGELAEILRTRGLEAQTTAHFLIQCLFCMFAEDVDLLPRGIFPGLLTKSANDPSRAANRLIALFKAMQKGGDYGDDVIAWFNGGLFESIAVPTLEQADLVALLEAAKMDWRNIDPSIFGTLFERGLNPSKRAQLGAHYTDPATIMKLVEPVIVGPLLRDWSAIRERISALSGAFGYVGKKKDMPNAARKEGQQLFMGFLERLRNFRVLDPACGSGNFLFLSLKSLKDLERRVNTEAEALGLQRQVNIEVSPANVLGIELDAYAAELARVTVWIGEIQWMLRNGYAVSEKPILKPLDTIENGDALVKFNAEGTLSEAQWPSSHAIVGNPPFLGGNRMRSELGNEYSEALRKHFSNRVPGGADLVTYWFEKARAQIDVGKCERAGLVGTQSVRKGSNRKVLARITGTTKIFNAWSDEEWVNEGAGVRVSLVCFGSNPTCTLDGKSVTAIHADLTSGTDLTQAQPLEENAGVAFQGPVKVGNFDIPGETARQWLSQPNPNGRPNSEVVRPWANGQDVTARPSDTWIIDFGIDRTEKDCALYEIPFAHVLSQVKPMRDAGTRKGRKTYWWRHGETVPALRAALAPLKRYIATPRVAKHRLFIWLDVSVLPDSRLYAIAREDDSTFGVLSSRFHEIWALANASKHGDGDDGGRPTYNAKSCFEAFPFPAGLADSQLAHISAAAQALNDQRNNWLQPHDWVDWIRIPEEEAAGYPPRPIPKTGHEADLRKRTLTNLYNVRPKWLENAHQALDVTVAQAYGWNDYVPSMPDEEILSRLLQINLERAAGNG